MMIDFFGTLPGLLSLAGLAVLLILVSLIRRLSARARARRAAPGSAKAPAEPPAAGPPRWVVAAVAAWAAAERDGPVPSAAAWKAGLGSPELALGGQDPWLASGWRNVGVTK